MITVSYLEAYDTGKLRGVATDWEAKAKQLDDQAAELEAEAREVQRTYPGGGGRSIANEIREQAREVRNQAARMRAQIPVVNQCATDVDDAKSKLIAAKNFVSGKPLAWDNLGKVRITATGDAAVKNENLSNRTTAEHKFFLALDKATRADNKAAAALYRAEGQEPPFQVLPDTGPINLDDASVRDQAQNSKQGVHGDCYFLSSLMALAESDPNFVREHMVWKGDHWEVTLYDNMIFGVRENVIKVYPSDLDSTGTKGPDGEWNFLSVYEAAYRQTLLGKVQTSDIPGPLGSLGGVPSGAMLTLTGKQADFSLVNPKDFSEIRDATNANPPRAVAVGTKDSHLVDEGSIPFDKRLCPNHAYQVKGFDEQGRIILVNPWGPGSTSYPTEVHLTEEEFRQQTMQTAIANR